MKKIEKVLVVDYLKHPPSAVTEGVTTPTRDVIRSLIQDINSLGKIGEEFENIVFDSLAPMADEVLSYITAIDNKKDTEIQHYKRAIKKLTEIITSSFSYQKSTVLIAHIQAEKDDITGRARMNPNVWGKDLPSAIPKMFSEVFQSVTVTGKGGVEYKWNTKPDQWLGFLGTRRFDNLQSQIDQDFTKLYGEKPKPFSALILGDSHTGKTRSVGTLPGRTILFCLEQQIAGYDSLRVPYEVTESLVKWMNS